MINPGLLISLLPSVFQYEGYIRRREANAAPVTKAVEVITSVERGRRWSRADKEQIVAAAMEPGTVASEVARAAGIHTSQLFRWRQQLCKQVHVPVAFNPVAVTLEPGAELAAGGRMRITGAVDTRTVAALMKALAGNVCDMSHAAKIDADDRR